MEEEMRGGDEKMERMRTSERWESDRERSEETFGQHLIWRESAVDYPKVRPYLLCGNLTRLQSRQLQLLLC